VFLLVPRGSPPFYARDYPHASPAVRFVTINKSQTMMASITVSSSYFATSHFGITHPSRTPPSICLDGKIWMYQEIVDMPSSLLIVGRPSSEAACLEPEGSYTTACLLPNFFKSTWPEDARTKECGIVAAAEDRISTRISKLPLRPTVCHANEFISMCCHHLHHLRILLCANTIPDIL
jgi:hypothetical protein